METLRADRRSPAGVIMLVVLTAMLGLASMWIVMLVPDVANPDTTTAAWYTPGGGLERSVPLLEWLGQPPMTVFVLAGAFALLCAAYAMAMLMLWRRRLKLGVRSVLLVTAAASLPLLAQPRLLSGDVHSYAIYGRIVAVHGGNPFIDLPEQYPDDAVLPYVYWRSTVSVYGPVWMLLSIPVTWTAELLGGSPWVYVLSYKVVAVLCHLVNMLLLYRVLLTLRPERAVWGMALYGWNPLVLVEFAGSGHNDALMVMLLLVAILLEVKGRPSAALIALVCAGLVKPVAMLLVPPYALYRVYVAHGRRTWVFARQVLIGLATLAVLYAPFWQGLGTLRILVNAPAVTVFTGSLAARVYYALENKHCPEAARYFGVPPAEQPAELLACKAKIARPVRTAFLGAFALMYLTLLFYPIRSFQNWIARCVGMLLAYLLLGAMNFQPWYGTWLLVFAPMMRGYGTILAVVACMLFLRYAPVNFPFQVSLIFGPLVLLALAQLLAAFGLAERVVRRVPPTGAMAAGAEPPGPSPV